jgi:hypothetical protein
MVADSRREAARSKSTARSDKMAATVDQTSASEPYYLVLVSVMGRINDVVARLAFCGTCMKHTMTMIYSRIAFEKYCCVVACSTCIHRRHFITVVRAMKATGPRMHGLWMDATELHVS